MGSTSITRENLIDRDDASNDRPIFADSQVVGVFSGPDCEKLGSPLAPRAGEVCDMLESQVRGAAPCGAQGLDFAIVAERMGALPQNILQKNDRIGMRNPLEMRYPFLDPDVVRFSERLPVSSLVDEQEGKKVVKMAAEMLGIPSQLSRRKKVRLQAPYATYLRRPEVADYFRAVIAEPPDELPCLYDPRLADDFLFGPSSDKVWRRPAKIMLLATLNLWAQSLSRD